MTQIEFKKDEVTYLPINSQLKLFLFGFIGSQIISTIITLLLTFYGISIYGNNVDLVQKFLDSLPVTMFVNSVAYLFTYLGVLLSTGQGIPLLLNKFKNSKAYVAAFCGIAAIFIFNFVYNAFLSSVGVEIEPNLNESALEKISKAYSIPALFMFGIIAPIVEELTYRVGLFSLCSRKGKAFAYTITIIFFTLIHVEFFTDNIVMELLNIPFYCFAAATFSFLYDKYGFAASTTAHVANNVISILLSLF